MEGCMSPSWGRHHGSWEQHVLLIFCRNIIFALFSQTYRLPANPGRVPWDLSWSLPAAVLAAWHPATAAAPTRPVPRVPQLESSGHWLRQERGVWNVRLEPLLPLQRSLQISKWAGKDARLSEQPAWGSSDPGVQSPLGRDPNVVQAISLDQQHIPKDFPIYWSTIQFLCLMVGLRDSRQH